MTISQDRNDRREQRFDLEETIFIEIIASAGSSAASIIMCNTVNISASGLQVIADEEISVGSILRICVDPKDADPIYLVAEAKWDRPDAETGGFRIGFLLFESDDTDWKRWQALVAELSAK